MEVYFDGNFWGHRPEGLPGEKKNVEQTFDFAGRTWRIPAVYICPEGVVVDCCVRIPKEEIAAFQKKWGPTEPEEISDELLEQAGRENPFELGVRLRADINGKPSNGAGCGMSWSPLGEGQESAHAPEESELLDAYGCDRTWGWKFIRCRFAWPEEEASLRALTLILEREPSVYPGPRFRAGMDGECPRVEFTHPKTGRIHVLSVLGCKQEEMPELEPRMRALGHPDAEWPGHFLRMEYQVEPETAPGELQVLDCVSSDQPLITRGAASVTIIGGADGPTSVFIGGKIRTEPEVQSAFSSIHFKPVRETEWRISIQVKEDERLEIPVEVKDAF